MTVDDAGKDGCGAEGNCGMSAKSLRTLGLSDVSVDCRGNPVENKFCHLAILAICKRPIIGLAKEALSL